MVAIPVAQAVAGIIGVGGGIPAEITEGLVVTVPCGNTLSGVSVSFPDMISIRLLLLMRSGYCTKLGVV